MEQTAPKRSLTESLVSYLPPMTIDDINLLGSFLGHDEYPKNMSDDQRRSFIQRSVRLAKEGHVHHWSSISPAKKIEIGRRIGYANNEPTLIGVNMSHVTDCQYEKFDQQKKEWEDLVISKVDKWFMGHIDKIHEDSDSLLIISGVDRHRIRHLETRQRSQSSHF